MKPFGFLYRKPYGFMSSGVVLVSSPVYGGSGREALEGGEQGEGFVTSAARSPSVIATRRHLPRKRGRKARALNRHPRNQSEDDGKAVDRS
jgi:hypothetical protein